MADLALVSTHRLHEAGRLRDALREEGFSVDLVPDPDHLPDGLDGDRAAVVILTGGEDDASGRARWMEDSASRRFPVFAVWPAGRHAGGPQPGSSRSGEASNGKALGVPGPVEVFHLGQDASEVALVARRTVQRWRLQEATGIVGESDEIRQILERVVQIAPVDSTVLVTGESGTGKELVARGIHHLSPRRHKAFLAVNVAALSETLLESELFGHEKGAFTGAIDSRKGFFELAHRGTLFLDEIGEMPMATQTKLLRVLEQREFLRVGGESPIRVDVRIVAATNRNLQDLVVEGAFRRDLFYRLNILDLRLPPLRERRDDIPRLVEHFIDEISSRIDRPFPGISPAAMQHLVDHPWPGNVRELRNLVESMVVMTPDREVQPADLPIEVREPGRSLRMLPRPESRALMAPESGGERRPARPGPKGDEEELDSEGAPRFRPELEFVFRTLMEMRVDMEELRREFDVYRDEVDERLDGLPETELQALPGGIELGTVSRPGHAPPADSAADDGPPLDDPPHPGDATEGDAATEADVLHFEPGMTMDELEEHAIRAVLQREDGNRRRAAESLGIGERTLYRKIRKYGIDE